MIKKLSRIFAAASAALTAVLFSICGVVSYLTPNEITVSTDSELYFYKFPISLKYDGTASAAITNSESCVTADIMLFGTVPIKEINIKNGERKNVILGGEPFGIRIYTDGLVVAQTSDVPTIYGNKNPSSDAGILCGDIITCVNGESLKTNEQLLHAVEKSQGNPIRIEGIRDNEPYSTYITPQNDIQQHCYKIGLWVRDSCAGLGTLTFIDPQTNFFAGLGHGICDTESGSIMPLSEGDIVPAEISSVRKSTCGSPGTLLGSFSDDKAIGILAANSEYGLYGKLSDSDKKNFTDNISVPIAFRQEVVRGKAQIRSTISGTSPEYYNIEIEEISYNNNNTAKNMVIKITDEKLLSQTGGIVQGMSGSPIIQNGRLVGAVTHVFINDPTHGYAVFVENMEEFVMSINKMSQN